jgi:hypothetical protein
MTLRHDIRIKICFSRLDVSQESAYMSTLNRQFHFKIWQDSNIRDAYYHIGQQAI